MEHDHHRAALRPDDDRAIAGHGIGETDIADPEPGLADGLPALDDIFEVVGPVRVRRYPRARLELREDRQRPFGIAFLEQEARIADARIGARRPFDILGEKSRALCRPWLVPSHQRVQHKPIKGEEQWPNFVFWHCRSRSPQLPPPGRPSQPPGLKSPPHLCLPASFGDAGAYERIVGIAHMRIDPGDAANQGIVDLALAPRAADGMVAYDVDVVILRPKNPARAERVLLYDVVNRGMRLLSMFPGANPGDGLLLRRAIPWCGAAGRATSPGAARQMLGALPPGMTMPKPLVARFPIATNSGQPITGPVSTEMIFDLPAGDRIKLPYAAATPDQPGPRRRCAR